MKPSFLQRVPISLLMVVATLLLSPHQAASADLRFIAITDQLFLTAGDPFPAEKLQQKLVELNSTVSHQRQQVGDQLLSAGDSIWVASQTRDYGLNPNVLLATLSTEGSLARPPTGSFTLYAQQMSQRLWDGFGAYQLGERRLVLGSGEILDFGEESNAATYALASYFAPTVQRQPDLEGILNRWSSIYQSVFGEDPRLEPPKIQAAPDVAPFLRLPFQQPAEDFIRINSFFDHVSPGITFDDTLLRFDGSNLTNALFSSCSLGVNCYGGHNGIDYSTGAGMPILAAADGVVVYRYFNTDPNQGNVDSGLIIDHGNGYRTAYWHMDPIQVSYGATVTQGQQVGLSGNVGRSSGPHLHFGLRITSGNKSVDPFGWWGSQADPWGDSQWMWYGNLIADNREPQTQLFYRNYWIRDNKGYNGDSWYTYSVNSASSSTNWGIWGTFFSSPGRYDVYAYWPKNADNTTNARYKVYHAGGVTTVAKNQVAEGDQFVYLGTFNFNRGAALVMLSDLTSDSGKRVYFDAVRWVFHAEQPPTDLNLSSSTIAENQPAGTVIGSFTTTDPEVGDSFVYSLVSGTGSADNSSFTINGNQLLSNTSFDYEAKSNYSIRVRTTDLGGNFYEKAFIITVTNQNDPPSNISLSSSSIAENLPAGSIVGSLTATDQDVGNTHTFSLVGGVGAEDNASFSISGSTLRTTAQFDFERKNTYSIRLRATDNGVPSASFEKQFTISIVNANDPPTDISLSNTSVLENQPIGTIVGVLAATDQDSADNHTFALVTGSGSADNGLFAIQGSQLRTNAVFDAEVRNTYSIRLRVTDSGGAFYEKPLNISIANINEFPPTGLSITSTTIAENLASNAVVGALLTSDSDVGDTFTYTLVTGEGGQDNAAFNINGNALRATASLDYETQNIYHVRIRTTDSGGWYYEGAFTITVINTNDLPTEINLSNTVLAENLPAGTVVGFLSAIDQDAGSTHTFSLVSGSGSTDNSFFAINGNSLRTAAPLDFETRPTCSIRLRVTDNQGGTFEKTFSITITNANDAPTDLALSSTSVFEQQPIGTLVGTLSTTDQDTSDTHTYTLVSGSGGNDNASFTISGNALRTNAVFDRQVKSSYSIRIRTTDGLGAYYEKAFTITILRYNYPPTDIALSNTSIAENQPVGTTVGSLSTVDPNADDTFTYSLVTGAGSNDNASFTISGNKLKSAAIFNFELKNSYQVRIRTTDHYGAFYEKPFTITVTNLNEAPTGINLSSDTVAENLPPGTTVAVLSAIDPDIGDTHTFALVPGTGSTDNASFSVSGTSLLTATTFDFETRNTYEIRLRATDSGGLKVEKRIIIHISNANDTPYDIDLDNSRIPENMPIGTVIGHLTTSDQDIGDVHTYSLVPGNGDSGNPHFSISGNQLLTSAVFDYESISSYTIRLRTTDMAGAYYEEIITIDIVPVNEYAPTGIILNPSRLPENRSPGTRVGILTALDQDLGDPHTFELVNGNGDDDNIAFYVEDDLLKTNRFFDFEERSLYTIRLRTTDSGGLTFEQVILIQIEDQLEYYLPFLKD